MSILHINHGDFPKAYQAIVDDINAKGGIHGRKLDATMVGINPTSQSAADQRLHQAHPGREGVRGRRASSWPTTCCATSNTNATATIGGAQTPARLAQAKAPWFSTDAGENLEINVVKTLAKQGKLNGKLAVMATAADQDAAQRQDQAGADRGRHQAGRHGHPGRPHQRHHRHLRPGRDHLGEVQGRRAPPRCWWWASPAPARSCRAWPRPTTAPSCVVSDLFGMNAYTGNKGNDFTVLKDAISGGPFGPNDAQLALGGPTKACMDVQRKAGLVIKPSVDGASRASPISSWPRPWPASRWRC